MANPNHLEVLRRGVEAWNEWRKTVAGIRPDLTDVDLTGEVLIRANLELTLLSRTKLIGANLNGADARGAEFVEADLSGAHLNGADLRGANFECANLTEVNFGGANLSFTKLNGADFNRAYLFETIFGNTDLSGVKNLDACSPLSPCILDYRTLAKSGDLPLSFLRGCGLPDTFIEYLPSLFNEPLLFYTCFISYTEADDQFSERLYNDLQDKGVRCWRWKEDAKIGRTLMRSIDSAIRIYDKLIVICSKDSLESPAVIREIERALQKEDDLQRRGKEPEVLFPIRLDDYVFRGWEHFRKSDVLQKNVGDFHNWVNPRSYKAAFERLLRDLKP
jgi:hypothetical protein